MVHIEGVQNIIETPASNESMDLRGAYAGAEEGMTEIPEEVVVSGVEEILNATNLSPDALEAYRVSQSAD